MSYHDFLAAFAAAQGLSSTEALLSEHAKRYSFQISSRERAKKAIELIGSAIPIDFSKASVLDVGCAYGSFSIEFANLGAHVAGIDISDKWLKLAEVNARGEVEPSFIKCDASSRTALDLLKPHAPFDLVVLNDVFEHIYDTVGLLTNLKALMRPGSFLYYKVPNGLCTRSVISEGHRKKFGISLLAPDYWPLFIQAPFQIYYRRHEYFEALFTQFGFVTHRIFNEITDPSLESTQQHIKNDLGKIRAHLKVENFENRTQLLTLQQACRHYFDEVEQDLATLNWWDLFYKYRVSFWEGLLKL